VSDPSEYTVVRYENGVRIEEAATSMTCDECGRRFDIHEPKAVLMGELTFCSDECAGIL
jgi:hypothetical protein